MKILTMPQRSEEWFQYKVGKIGGTRFGQATSSRKNRLKYDLLNEQFNGYIEQSEYESEEMQFGVEMEPEARQKYIEQSGIEFIEVGAIESDFSPIHMASPDGVNVELGIVLEIKCTQNGAIHIQRYFEGPESSYMPQIINYFAVSDDVKEVHWVSYCPYREEKQLVKHVFTRADVDIEVKKGRYAIKQLESELNKLEQSFIF